jgi:ABC-2 type transport system permease protein
MIELAEDEETPRGFGSGIMIVGDGPTETSDGPKRKPVVKPAPKAPDADVDPDILSLNVSQGDRPGPLPAVVGLTRTINGKEQRIVVSGDADFLSNAELARFNIKTCNFDFSTGIFSWFAHGEFPIDSSRPPYKDKRLNLTDGGLTLLKISLLGILPAILLIIGSILLIRRKRK